MMSYWQQLKPRERMLLMIGGVVFSILMLYLLMLEPLTNKVDKLSVKIEKQKTQVQYLKTMAKEVAALQKSGGGSSSSKRQGQSLLVLVDRTSKQGKLGKNVTRVEPDGSARVRVWLEGAAFDDVTKWLAGLETQYNILVESAVIDKTELVGRVNVRMVFIEGGA
ncbi:MAG: type II secretion system protein M [Gammaproteobacteria bacterium]|nr:type II secretion system protein M [Gammaproteobacteria bacterium]